MVPARICWFPRGPSSRSMTISQPTCPIIMPISAKTTGPMSSLRRMGTSTRSRPSLNTRLSLPIWCAPTGSRMSARRSPPIGMAGSTSGRPSATRMRMVTATPTTRSRSAPTATCARWPTSAALRKPGTMRSIRMGAMASSPSTRTMSCCSTPRACFLRRSCSTPNTRPAARMRTCS